MRRNAFRTLSAAVAVVAGTLVWPLGPGAQSASALLPWKMTCTVDGKADFWVTGGKLHGKYDAQHHGCQSLQFPQYSSFRSIADPIVVNNCPQTDMTGTAQLIWTKKDGSTEPGTANFVIKFYPTKLQAEFSLTIAGGPLQGGRFLPLAVPLPTAALACPGSKRLGYNHVVIKGLGNIVQ